jgi:hypothetical protein
VYTGHRETEVILRHPIAGASIEYASESIDRGLKGEGGERSHVEWREENVNKQVRALIRGKATYDEVAEAFPPGGTRRSEEVGSEDQASVVGGGLQFAG